ncbi:hypothetical protein D3C81_1194720 [compost metagenome]
MLFAAAQVDVDQPVRQSQQRQEQLGAMGVARQRRAVKNERDERNAGLGGMAGGLHDPLLGGWDSRILDAEGDAINGALDI